MPHPIAPRQLVKVRIAPLLAAKEGRIVAGCPRTPIRPASGHRRAQHRRRLGSSFGK